MVFMLRTANKSLEGTLISRKFVSTMYKDRPVFIEVEPLGYRKISEHIDDMFRIVLYSKGRTNIMEIYKL